MYSHQKADAKKSLLYPWLCILSTYCFIDNIDEANNTAWLDLKSYILQNNNKIKLLNFDINQVNSNGNVYVVLRNAGYEQILITRTTI